MKQMKAIYMALVALFLFVGSACTKYNIVETGVAQGKHDTSMLEYLQSDPYHYSMLVELIKRAELTNEFSAVGGEGITFFAPHNHSIRIYLYQQGDKKLQALKEEQESQGNYDPIAYKATDYSIKDIPVEVCQDLILSCIVPKRYMRADIPRGAKSTNAEESIGQGGMKVMNKAGRELWIYTFQEPYGDVPASGAISVNVVSPETQTNVRVGSADVETKTGIVHTMPYGFIFGKIK